MMEKAHFIESKIFLDNRGSFSPLDLSKLNKNWVQSNISVNPRNTHFGGYIFKKTNLHKLN